MPLRPDMEFQDYLRVLSKRKWIIILTYISLFVAASVYIVLTPKLYKSSTTILSIPQKVPPSFIPSTVTVGAGDRMATIEQLIKSRTRLKRVMEDVGVFAKARKEGLEDETIRWMNKRIDVRSVVNPLGKEIDSQTESQAFSISFLHEDPTMAMLTASRIASLFIEENDKLREKQAVGTSEFLESQLKETKARLDVQEQRVKKFKMRHSGELPQELQTNLANLQRLQDQYRMATEGIRAAEQRLLSLHSSPSSSEDTSLAIRRELNLRRNQLVELTTKYTNQYPDVIRMREEVEELEKKLANSSSSPSTDTKLVAAIESEIDALKREREHIRRNTEIHQAKVDQAPLRDQELIIVTRDYDNLKNQYNELLRKKSEADISQNLEVREKGTQYRVLDPANLPKDHSVPNITKIFGLAFFVAGFLGFGGAIAMERMDLSLRGVTDFKHFFDIPILASIPILETVEIGRRQKLRKKAIIGGIVSVTFTIFAFLFFFLWK